jgi:hypothetical protein
VALKEVYSLVVEESEHIAALKNRYLSEKKCRFQYDVPGDEKSLPNMSKGNGRFLGEPAIKVRFLVSHVDLHGDSAG